MDRTYRNGALLVVAAALLWSTMGLAIRMIEGAGTWQVLLYRSVGMVPPLLLFLMLRGNGRPWAMIRGAGGAAVVGALGLVLAFSGAIYAIQTTTVANAVFLFAAAPFFTAALAWAVLGERVRRATLAAMALAGLGMAVMVREGLGAGALDGNIAAIASALGFACFTVSLRWGRLGNMIPAVLLAGVFASIFALVMILALGQSVLISPRDTVISLSMGVFQLGLGLSIYTIGSRVVPAAELSLLSMIEVLFAPIWVLLLLAETASAATWAGGLILLAAIAGNAISGMRSGKLPSPVRLTDAPPRLPPG